MRPPFHGHELRGLSAVSRSPLFEGRFGRMFRNLPPRLPDRADLEALAREMIEPQPTGEEDPAAHNPDIPAGFTYVGQFVDHDLTFDPLSQLQQDNDPDALVDFRTPRFDLDSIYGRGPDDQPFLYEDDGVHLLIGRNKAGDEDLPRNVKGRALLGDARNDENLIISGLTLGVLKYHNRVVDTPPLAGLAPVRRFDEARRIVRWHYQWAVIHDFLARLVGTEVIEDILHAGHSIQWALFFQFEGSKLTPQPSRKIDTKLSFGLNILPENVAAGIHALAERDLKRGKALGLPSGQAISRTIGLPEDLILHAADLRPLPDHLIQVFGENTPLFFYLLKEAEKISAGRRLGPTGGRIVAEVFIGLLRADPSSYLNVQPTWQPKAGEFGARKDGEFTITDLLRFARVRID